MRDSYDAPESSVRPTFTFGLLSHVRLNAHAEQSLFLESEAGYVLSMSLKRHYRLNYLPICINRLQASLHAS